MSSFATPAIMLRRVDFGDFDLIVTFLTLTRGKISAIAKSAKKSTKRFAGTLELFSVLELVCHQSRQKKGLPLLQEVTLKQPFAQIRCDIKKTAYASYWVEIINEWMEENESHEKLYRLLVYVLSRLNKDGVSEALLSILFQMRFLKLAGLSPDLSGCSCCLLDLESTAGTLKFDLSKGGMVCHKCAPETAKSIRLSRGTVKQLRWLDNDDLDKASRVRFSPAAINESLSFLEAFVPFHLGKKPRSLTFLQQLRR